MTKAPMPSAPPLSSRLERAGLAPGEFASDRRARLAGHMGAAMFAMLPSLACAAEAQASPASGIVQMVVGLALVLGLIVLASWALKRFGAGATSSGSAIKVLTAASVGPRERVVLVEISDTWLVLGVAPGRVSALHQLPRQALPAVEPAAAGFSRWLADARRRQDVPG